MALADPNAGATSTVAGYEAMRTEDAVVHSLSAREWSDNQLAGPRCEFRRNNYTNPSGERLHQQAPPQVLPLSLNPSARATGQASNEAAAAAPRAYADAEGPLAPVSARGPRPRHARRTEDADDAPWDTNGLGSATRGRRATPRRGTAPHHYCSDSDASGGPAGRQDPYANVQSVVAGYCSGRLSYLEARHGAARSRGSTPVSQRARQNRSGTPLLRSAYTEELTPRVPRSARSAGPPRCYDMVPERHRYKPKETEEEKTSRLAREEAEAAAEQKRGRGRASSRQSKAAKPAPDEWGPWGPDATTLQESQKQKNRRSASNPASGRKGSRSASRGARSRRNKRSPARSVHGSFGNASAVSWGGNVSIKSRTLYRPMAGFGRRSLMGGESPPAQQSVRTPRDINPFEYRKMLLFPTDAPQTAIPIDV